MLNLTFCKCSGLVDSVSYVRSLLAASPPESNLSPKSHVLNLLPLLPLHTRFCVLKLGILHTWTYLAPLINKLQRSHLHRVLRPWFENNLKTIELSFNSIELFVCWFAHNTFHVWEVLWCMLGGSQVEVEWITFFISPLRVKLVLACQELLKWVWTDVRCSSFRFKY